MKLNLFKTIYLRNATGQYVCGISIIKASTIAVTLLVILTGILYSIVYAPMLNAKITETDVVQEAVARKIWTATGTQGAIEGNIIWDKSTDATEAQGTYLGDNTQELYEFKEWEMKETRKELNNWKLKAGEPTAILTNACRQNGVAGSECPKILYAMAQQESYLCKALSGDGGRSRGCFHIMDYHNVPKSCADDLACSADWTIKRMIRQGFKTDPDTAVMLHNGTPNTKATLAYLDAVNRKKSLWPN